MKRPMEGQLDLLFEEPPATDQILEIGQVVFKVICGEVIPYEVSSTFECKDRFDINLKTVRYHLRNSKGGGDTIGKYDIFAREVYFANESDAREKAHENLNVLDVIRAVEIEPIKYSAYASNDKICVVALLPNNKVYRKGVYTYAFIDQYTNEQDAFKQYKKEINNQIDYINNFCPNDKYEETDPVFQDVYGMGDGHWASPEYALNNWLYPTFLVRK